MLLLVRVSFQNNPLPFTWMTLDIFQGLLTWGCLFAGSSGWGFYDITRWHMRISSLLSLLPDSTEIGLNTSQMSLRCGIVISTWDHLDYCQLIVDCMYMDYDLLSIVIYIRTYACKSIRIQYCLESIIFLLLHIFHSFFLPSICYLWFSCLCCVVILLGNFLLFLSFAVCCLLSAVWWPSSSDCLFSAVCWLWSANHHTSPSLSACFLLVCFLMLLSVAVRLSVACCLLLSANHQPRPPHWTLTLCLFFSSVCCCL